jgi:hypothetical protein
MGGKQLIKRVQVPLSRLKEGALSIKVAGGPLTYSARVRYGRSLEKAKAASEGFQITRTLVDGHTGAKMDVVRAGDLCRIELRIRATERRTRVALVDYLPAGLEPINPRLSGGEDRDQARDRSEGFEAIEIHDDRVAVFADELEPGRDRTFSYLARATSAGTYLLPAARVEEMYRPEHRARTDSGILEVKPR